MGIFRRGPNPDDEEREKYAKKSEALLKANQLYHDLIAEGLAKDVRTFKVADENRDQEIDSICRWFRFS